MTTEALDDLLRALPDTHVHGLHPGDGPVDADTVRAWLDDLHQYLTTLPQVLP